MRGSQREGGPWTAPLGALAARESGAGRAFPVTPSSRRARRTVPKAIVVARRVGRLDSQACPPSRWQSRASHGCRPRCRRRGDQGQNAMPVPITAWSRVVVSSTDLHTPIIVGAPALCVGCLGYVARTKRKYFRSSFEVCIRGVGRRRPRVIPHSGLRRTLPVVAAVEVLGSRERYWLLTLPCTVRIMPAAQQVWRSDHNQPQKFSAASP